MIIKTDIMSKASVLHKNKTKWLNVAENSRPNYHVKSSSWNRFSQLFLRDLLPIRIHKIFFSLQFRWMNWNRVIFFLYSHAFKHRVFKKSILILNLDQAAEAVMLLPPRTVRVEVEELGAGYWPLLTAVWSEEYPPHPWEISRLLATQIQVRANMMLYAWLTWMLVAFSNKQPE